VLQWLKHLYTSTTTDPCSDLDISSFKKCIQSTLLNHHLTNGHFQVQYVRSMTTTTTRWWRVVLKFIQIVIFHL